jgi:D-arabinose 1-dehydrogenase-like Zn-dependent alcohol dehydrogenase
MTRLRSVEVTHSENRTWNSNEVAGHYPSLQGLGRAGRYAMRAVVLQEYGGPENLRCEDNVPDPQISGNTVLIAAAAASVNPIDWKLRSGLRRKDSPLSFPAILGRDVSGIVWAVGTDVKHFKAGDRVLALSIATYAELVAVDDSDVTHLPDGVALADAAAIPLIALTGDQLVRLAANVQKGQIVLVTGALGTVGRAAVHTAKKIGAQVIAGVRGKELDDARTPANTAATSAGSPHSSARARNGICQSAGGGIKPAGKSCVPLLSNVRCNASRILRFSSPPAPIRRAMSTKSFTLLFAAFRGSV